MTEKKQDELLDHNYDGIQEYDNDLPRWWVSLFWLCILFGVAYYGYFHLGSGKFRSEHIHEDMALLTEIKKDIEQKVASSVSEEVLAKFVTLSENVDKGKKTYLEKCMPCHGDQGQGIIGPNLTDNFWIHGGKLMEIRQVILKGVLDKGMVPWEAVLKENEVQELVAFIYSLRGTNPANPKAAEGIEVKND